ncbi:hypothetical protein BDA96_02G023700 [Sorghum bicolor]|uniref:F-box domain-containing protein n=1 Tax=Sorghum bicolor TaxID=4558 RepID=A0A921RM95_SORBI|nr:hypothetical protein BDA96_02G023700 [Sorghum bicolor]
MAPPPRELVSDIISEILLRLPPDEPECLFRAALVCKPWLRTISDPGFLSRYRAFHGTPPLLVLIDADQKIDRSWSFRLVPTRVVPAFPFPAPDTCGELPLDCRHGRVLIGMVQDWRMCYLVLDPVTGFRCHLPQPKIRYAGIGHICSAAADCRHLDCHGDPFCVVLMIRDGSTATMSATFYSSEIGAWSEAATLQGIRGLYGRGALIGDGIYFMLYLNTGIIKYDWGKNSLSLANPPPSVVYSNRVTLMVMEDSSLGIAEIKHSSLYLWSRRASSEENAEWVQCRVIDLDTMMPMANPSDGAYVVGFAEGVDVIFVRTLVGLFMMELKSGRVTKRHEPDYLSSVLPYMAFYTPDHSRLSHLGGSTVL